MLVPLEHQEADSALQEKGTAFLLKKPNSVDRRLLLLLSISIVLIFLLTVTGGMIRTYQTGSACLGWPTCNGSWLPPVDSLAWFDWVHRLLAVLSGLFLLAASIQAVKKARHETWVVIPTLASMGLVFIQGILGALLVRNFFWQSQPLISGLHLLLALLSLGGIGLALVVAIYRSGPIESPIKKLVFQTPFSRLGLVTLVFLAALMVSGVFVAASGASSECLGWPLCNPVSSLGWIALGHNLIVGLALITFSALFFLAWRTQRSSQVILTATSSVVVLLVSQSFLGAKLVEGFPAYLLTLHEVVSVAAWVAMIVAVTAMGIEARSLDVDITDRRSIAGRKPGAFFKDLLMLTKPVVVLLLLVTTFAGMVIGAQAWPPFNLVFWTLLGGFMAAGGSGAINQVIDRDDDRKMQRTQKRPIPAGRLTPGEALAFGAIMTLGSFFVMAAFVNLLTALLTLAGIVYYVLLYSIFLKKTTVQNIVIGGGAGAIPPLVGWAAATGSLDIPSLFLFAVVFMWTPPHFWALAIVRRSDYARAGVPMLPVIRGEEAARWHILIYTLGLVALTLLLPVFGLGGAVYIVGATLLGLGLIGAAYRVWKIGGNRVTWMMYRYSSMYLAILFLVLMVDRLL